MKRNRRKVRTGTVTSSKMDKTIVVAVERTFKHPQYGKTVKRTSKVYAHDEENQAGVGDVVMVVETRPLSKAKRWRLTKILEKSK
jgi:small subunit ribosomal protein S17